MRGVLAHQEEHKVQGIEDPRGLFPFSKSLSRTSQKRVVKDAKYLALECEKEINHTKQLVDYIDHALAILDLPLPLSDDC